MSPVMFSMRMAEVWRKLSFMVVSLHTDHSFLGEEDKRGHLPPPWKRQP